MHNINVNNLSVQNLFFPLHDANFIPRTWKVSSIRYAIRSRRLETSYGKKLLRQSISNLQIVLDSGKDSGKDITTGYQKNPYHMVLMSNMT
jgi:hypothetical protein